MTSTNPWKTPCLEKNSKEAGWLTAGVSSEMLEAWKDGEMKILNKVQEAGTLLEKAILCETGAVK